MTRKCRNCEKPLGHYKSVFCSPECSDTWWRESRITERETRTLTCPRCGTEFETQDATKKYCTKRCSIRANKTKYKPRPLRRATCLKCGVEFTGKGNYCCPKHRPSYGRYKPEYIPRPPRHKPCVDCGTEIVTKTVLKRCPDCDRKNRNRYAKTSKRLRRNRMRNLESTLITRQWEESLEYFNGSCAYCGSGGMMQQDHFIPAFLGGGYTKENIVPACPKCNREKHNKPPEEWLAKKGVNAEKIFNFFNKIISPY